MQHAQESQKSSSRTHASNTNDKRARKGAAQAGALGYSDGVATLSPNNRPSYAVQQRALSPGQLAADESAVHAAAGRGTRGGGGTLPFLAQIQASFGRHDVSAVKSHTGGEASAACEQMGALAYASGNAVAFKDGPSLHTSAHEAAHIVQQRAGVSLKGGVGAGGDTYEQHADAVADLVVQGKSAEGLLDRFAGGGGVGSAGVQRKAAVQREEVASAEQSTSVDTTEERSTTRSNLGTRGETVHMATVYFPFDGTGLAADDSAVLDEVIDTYKDDAKAGTLEVDVNGFADSVGSSEYNNDLSVQRAESVKGFFSRVVPQTQVTTMGWGVDQAAASDALARRADLLVYAPERTETTKKDEPTPLPEVGDIDVEGVNDGVMDNAVVKWGMLAARVGAMGYAVVAGSPLAWAAAGLIGYLGAVVGFVNSIKSSEEFMRLVGAAYGVIAAGKTTMLPPFAQFPNLVPTWTSGGGTMRDADALEQAYTEAGLDTIGAMMDTDNPELVSLMYMINTGEVDATAMLNHIYQQLIDQYSPPYQGDPTDRSNSEIASDAWRTKQLSW